MWQSYFEDPVVKRVQPIIKTGKKWEVVEAVDQAKECLKIKKLQLILAAKSRDHLQQSGGKRQRE